MVKLTRKVPSVFGRPNSPSCVPNLYDLLADPFERATESIYYADWQVHRVFIQVPIQVLVGKGLESFKEFPPRAKAASFTVGDVMEQIEANAASAEARK